MELYLDRKTEVSLECGVCLDKEVERGTESTPVRLSLVSEPTACVVRRRPSEHRSKHRGRLKM